MSDEQKPAALAVNPSKEKFLKDPEYENVSV
jgi:hypothetical protein